MEAIWRCDEDYLLLLCSGAHSSNLSDFDLCFRRKNHKLMRYFKRCYSTFYLLYLRRANEMGALAPTSQGLESKTFTRLRDPHGRGNVAASGRSTLPGAFAVHPRRFHEDCKVHSPYAGFSGGTTESTSNVAGSRPTSGIRVAPPVSRPRRELLFGETERIMPHDAGVVSIKLD